MLAKLAAGQAGSQTVVVLSALKGDIAGGHKAVIQIDIDAIGARRHLLTLSKPDRSATAAGSSARKRGLK
jgi:hypothetical protein